MSQKTPQPRILILSTAYLPLVGGSELAIKHITDRISDVDFDLVTGRYDEHVVGEERIGAVRVIRVGGWWSRFGAGVPKILLPFAIFLAVRQLLGKQQYALIHVFQASQAGGAAWLLKKWYPTIPLLVTLQEGKDLASQSPIIGFFRKTILASADAISVISNYLKRYVTSLHIQVPIHLIPNGVAVKEFAAAAHAGGSNIRNLLHVSPNEKIVISISRLVPKNGLHNLMIAFASVVGRHTARLVLVGAGPLREELEDLSRDLGIAKRVSFMGEISHGQLPEYLGAADVFVRPSLSEGLGTAFLEAMACRVPVVASPVGGIPDFLTDRQTGLFCNPKDPHDIAAAITLLLSDTRLAEEIREAAYTLVGEKYDWNIIATRMRQLYAQFL